jgi:hypothetical protein
MDKRSFWSRASALAVALAAVLAAAILAGAALAAPNGVPGPPASDRTPPKAGQAPAAEDTGLTPEKQKKQDALLPVARHLAQQARDAGSDIAGVEIDVANGVVDVYRTDTKKPLGLPGGGPPAGVKVVVHQAKFSRAKLIDASEQLTREAQLLGEQGVSVQGVGPALDGSGITVSVLVDSGTDIEHASTELHRRYGSIVGQVRGVERKASADDLFFTGFRFNDYAPWYGGDRISSSVGGCSTGFAAVMNSAPAMLTAAHCGGVGTAFYNGPRSTGTFNYMGSSVYSNSGTDVNAIQVSSTSNYINVGSTLSPTQLYIGSWASPVVGQYLCQSGSYTGEVCALRVVDTAQYVCTGWFLWWCTSWQGPLADVINAFGSGSYAAGHGDSGGPVYLRTGSSGIAVGLVHGVLTPNAQAVYPAYVSDTMWCPSPEGWSQRCASGFSFAHMPGF